MSKQQAADRIKLLLSHIGGTPTVNRVPVVLEEVVNNNGRSPVPQESNNQLQTIMGHVFGGLRNNSRTYSVTRTSDKPTQIQEEQTQVQLPDGTIISHAKKTRFYF